MSNDSSFLRPLIRVLPVLLGRLSRTEHAGRIANSVPGKWLLGRVGESLVRYGTPDHSELTISRRHTTTTSLENSLTGIVQDVVESLGYVCAMVATYEIGDELPIRAIWVDPHLITMDQIRVWEEQVSQFTPDRPVSLTDPRVARVNVYRDEHAHNLSVIAAKSHMPEVRDDLFSLFVPIVPVSAKPIIDGIQKGIGIEQVIAVPFFLQTSSSSDDEPELVGNLFAIKRGIISQQDIDHLTAFGRRAAEAILSEHLRRRDKYVQELVLEIQKNLQNEDAVLQIIVGGVVRKLGYIAAMVATHERNGALPLRAIYIDPSVATVEQLQSWEARVSQFSPDKPLSLTNPRVARVNLNNKEDMSNLSVIAAQSKQPQVRDDLYSLLAPVVPLAAKPVIDSIQRAIGIYRVVAIPFFLETFEDGEQEPRLVGNLFALTTSRSFRRSEIELLQSFGQQAAVGIWNAKMYRRSENRRRAAEIFAKMAFSASASIHALRNQVGSAKTTLQLLEMFEKQPRESLSKQELEETEQLRLETFAQIPLAVDRLNQAARLLDTLHEPFRRIPDVPSDVNICLTRAVSKVLPTAGGWVQISLARNLPPINTVPDMLTEAFKVLIKNASEAIEAKFATYALEHAVAVSDSTVRDPRSLLLETRLEDSTCIIVTIQDNGTGIHADHLDDIFELGWTTKPTGMGFGLFWTKDFFEGLGGTIDVGGAWQLGTTFRVKLPISRELPNVEPRPLRAIADTSSV